MKVSLYNHSGSAAGEIELADRLFAVTPKPAVIHQVVVAQAANARFVIADTKNKGEVRGGGKKPWKQKGTGRARHGSSRSPIWRHGGVTFGPTTERNFSKGVNRKQKQLAMAMCLSDKVTSERLFVFDDLKFADGKTKTVSSWIKTMATTFKFDIKHALIITPKHDVEVVKAVRNLDSVRTISADSLNCIELLKADAVFVSTEGVATIDRHFVMPRIKTEAAQ